MVKKSKRAILALVGVLVISYSLYGYVKLVTGPRGQAKSVSLAGYSKMPLKGWSIPVSHKAGQKCPKGTGTVPDQVGGCGKPGGVPSGGPSKPPKHPKPAKYHWATIHFAAPSCGELHSRPTGRWWSARRYTATMLFPKDLKVLHGHLVGLKVTDVKFGRSFHVYQCKAHIKYRAN